MGTLLEFLIVAFVGAILGATLGMLAARAMFWRRIQQNEWARDHGFRPLVERYRNSEGQL